MQRRTVTRGKRKHYYYVCATYKDGKGCSSHSFEQKKLEETVLHAVSNQIQMVVELNQLVQDIGLNNIDQIRQGRIDVMIVKKEQDLDRDKEFRMKLYEAEISSGSSADNNWIMQFIKFKGISELTREVVVTLVDRIYVYEDKRIRIEFNYRNEIAAYQEIFQERAKEVV